MPNGRGSIDCCYCLHWSIQEEEWGYAAGRYDGRCNCWDVNIPRSLTNTHRFCLDFTPNRYFGEDNGVGHPGELRSKEEIAQECLRTYIAANPTIRIGVLYSLADSATGREKEIRELKRLDDRATTAE